MVVVGKLADRQEVVGMATPPNDSASQPAND